LALQLKQLTPRDAVQKRDAAPTPRAESAGRSVQRRIHREPVQREEGAPGQEGAMLSPNGKPAKEGEIKAGSAPSLQLHGYGGVRNVRGKLVKDIEKELADLDAKATAASAPGGIPLTADEQAKKTSHRATIDDINKSKRDDYLIFAGHIGVSLDNGASIYGFTPSAPEGMPGAQVVGHLHAHTMTFPGQVKNDKPHFDFAASCASAKGWDTEITTVTRKVTTAQHAESKKKLQELSGMMPGAHGLYYSFPLQEAAGGQWFVDTPGPEGRVVKGQNQANCATFPGKIGIELPEESGNLRYYMKAMRADPTATPSAP